jgi:heme o synthase
VAITFALLRYEAMGGVYVAAALTLGALFLWRALRLRRDTSPREAMRLFSFSNTYLALLFAAIAIDTLVR